MSHLDINTWIQQLLNFKTEYSKTFIGWKLKIKLTNIY